MNDGTVKAWGNNGYGQLGNDTNNRTSNPNSVPITIPGLTGVKQIEAGNKYSAALMEDGTVKMWGLNKYGQLGSTTNSGTYNPNPVPVTISSLTGVKQITAGDVHTVILTNDGSIKTCGFNMYGQLGISTNSGTSNPNPVPTTVNMN